MISDQTIYSQPGMWAPKGGEAPLRSHLAKATGEMLYASDMTLPDMLIGKALRSPYPHCRINRIEAQRALAIPGVHAVLTAQDIQGVNAVGKILTDQEILASTRARTVMDALALVAAESGEIADAALEAIDLDLTPLPAVFDPSEALKPDALPLHAGGNLLQEFKIVYGDAEAAMTEADIVIENEYYYPWIEHAFLETESALAAPNADGSITIWMGCHNIYGERAQLALTFGWPEERFRVILAPAGGSFGGKDDNILSTWCALLAHRTNRPVRIVFKRDESMRGHSKRHSQMINYRLGARQDGLLMAAQVEILSDTGAYAHWGPNIMKFACAQSTGPYRIPAAYARARLVYTNNIVAGAMRGWGTPGIEFAIESQLDILARRLDIHPLRLRWLNALRDGDETISGSPLPLGSRFRETLAAAARSQGINLKA